MAIRAAAVASAVRPPLLAVGQSRKMVDPFAGFEDDTAATSSVPPVGTSFRHVAFSAEADATIPAFARLQLNLNPVDKH